MLGVKERQFAPLGPLSLEDVVPADHFYRQLKAQERRVTSGCTRKM